MLQKQSSQLSSGWTNLAGIQKFRISLYQRKPISHSKTSIVYYGLYYDEQGQQRQIVIKKYLNPPDSKVQQKLRKIISQHILRPYFPLIISKKTQRVYQIYDYCNNGTLFNYLDQPSYYRKQLNLKELYIIFGSLIDGYNSLYQKGLIHGDLSPKSIFIYKGILKIGDIGYKKINMTSEQDLYSLIYSCPMSQKQQINCKQNQKTNVADKKISKESRDIYSLGLIFFQLIYRNHPYYNQKFFSHLKKLQKSFNQSQKLQKPSNQSQKYLDYVLGQKIQPLSQKQIINLSKQYLDKIKQMISIDPTKRPTFQQIYITFRPFIKQSNIPLSLSIGHSFPQENNINKVPSYSQVSKQSFMSLYDSISMKMKELPIENNQISYIKFLQRIKYYKQPLQKKTKDTENIEKLINILNEIIIKEVTKEGEQQLVLNMTALIPVSYDILSKIQKLDEEDIIMVKYLLDCHAIFVTKEQLETKTLEYKQFDQNESIENRIEVIKKIYKDFLIPSKILAI